MNPTGVKPVEYKILIRVEELEEKSEGGLWIPEEHLQRQQYAHDRGTLVDASEMAFTDWIGKKPKIGDKVAFSKYAGSLFYFQPDPNDRKKREQYRLINDKDVSAIVEG